MAKKKDNFIIIDDEEEYQQYLQEQLYEDDKVVKFLDNIVQKEEHRKFNFAILNLGVLMQTLSVFFNLKEKEMNEILSLQSDSVKQRKITVVINEINEKINLKYDFDENTEVVIKIFVYENQCHILINKILFLKLLFGTGFMEESNMRNI